MTRVREHAHPNCLLCSLSRKGGIGLTFAPEDGGGVEAAFDCPERYEGFPGMIHGGVITSLLDSAMMNCLFARGIVAYTAGLNVRFPAPLAVGRPARVRARLDASGSPLHVLEAEVVQDGRVKAKAVGKFLEARNG